MMLAHPVRREVRWRSALRRALSVVVRRSMESKIDQRMRIGELVYMKCRLRCFFMRETPRPSESPTFPPSLSARPPTPTLNAFSVDWSPQEPPQPRRPRAAFQTDYGAS